MIQALRSICFKRGPASLCPHLSCKIQCFLIYGYVPHRLLLATIIPLIKNKFGDMESSDNYHSIAIGSVVLKIIDWIVLLLLVKNLVLTIYSLATKTTLVQPCVHG